MIPLSTILRVVVGVFVFSSTGLHSFDPCLAQQENEEPNVFPLSTAGVPVPGQTTGKTFLTTVEWEGQEYSTREGTRVLMQAIMDPATDPGIRAKALERLSRLRNTHTTPQLVSLYRDLREREEKAGVILCLTLSGDPRGLPLLVRVLDNEQDTVVRLFAAGGLANWNSRRGVRELVSLLESRELLTGARPVANEALKAFQNLNRMKGWDYSEEEMLKTVERKSGFDQDQKISLLIEQIKKWFAENKHRFPDWKPGDPLPKVAPPEEKRPADVKH